jgi:hypothetical protein
MGDNHPPVIVFEKFLLDFRFVKIEVPEHMTGDETFHVAFLTKPAQIEGIGVDVVQYGILLEIPFRGAAFVNENIDVAGLLKKGRMEGCIAGIKESLLLIFLVKNESQGGRMMGNTQRSAGEGRKQIEFLSGIQGNEIDPAQDAFLPKMEQIEQSLTKIDRFFGPIQKNRMFF